MSFITTLEILAAAAGVLRGIGLVVAAQNAAAAGPTTDIAPAAADEVSARIATQFAAYGRLHQDIAAHAAATHEMIVNTLRTRARSYVISEAANAMDTG